jgi:hypothetical protein
MSKSELDKVCENVLGNQQKQYEYVMYNSKDLFMCKTFEDHILNPIIENVEDEKTLKLIFVWLDDFIENVIRVNDNFRRNGCNDEGVDDSEIRTISEMIEDEIGITTIPSYLQKEMDEKYGKEAA